MLRITKQTDYGIVLLARFAVDGTGRILNARDMAHHSGLPVPTVSKILKALARGGLLLSHRGVKGGYSLARDPEDINVEQIIHALEGPVAMTECSTDDCGCDIELSCPVRVPWQRINEAVLGALREIPLSEMVASMTFAPWLIARKES